MDASPALPKCPLTCETPVVRVFVLLLLQQQRRDARRCCYCSCTKALACYIHPTNPVSYLILLSLALFSISWHLDLRLSCLSIEQKKLLLAKYESSGSKRRRLPRDIRQTTELLLIFVNKIKWTVARERLLVATKSLPIFLKGE